MINTSSKIVITGGFGFIGSNLVAHLNSLNIVPNVLTKSMTEKWRNLAGLSFNLIEKNDIPYKPIIICLGANVDTTEIMNGALWDNNVNFPINLHETVKRQGGKFIYASSGAVYGAEESDFTERIDGLKPLNGYAFSKWQLDNHFFRNAPRFSEECNTYGLRFFNVYGPREDYKGNMASVPHKAFKKLNPIYKIDEKLNLSYPDKKPYWFLFKSYRPEIKHGEQARDYVAVSDVCKVIKFFIDQSPESGIYNLGSGRATSFNQIVKAVDANMPIKYDEMPMELKNQYQYYTCANLSKLRSAGYKEEFLTIEQGLEKMK